MYEKYSIEFDWYFSVREKGKLIAEEYLTDVLDYFKEYVNENRSSLSAAKMYKVQDMVNGIHNLRDAIRDAEEIEAEVKD